MQDLQTACGAALSENRILQGSQEWKKARAGLVTASRISDIFATGKGGAPSASRANYLAQLVCERMTGQPIDGFTSDAMKWGTEKEPEAKSMYSFTRSVDVVDVGLVHHPHIEMAAASPDGLVGDDGLIEIKAPQTATHIATLLGKAVDAHYVRQMQWQMACTGRRWCDFVSFDPRLPPEMQIYVKRITRDPIMIADMEREVRKFLADIDETIGKLRALYQAEAA